MDRQKMEGCGFTLIGEYKDIQHRREYLTLVPTGPNPYPITESSAVYAWTANDVVLYIGATDKLKTRLSTDHVRRLKPMTSALDTVGSRAGMDTAMDTRYTAELRKALSRGGTRYHR